MKTMFKLKLSMGLLLLFFVSDLKSQNSVESILDSYAADYMEDVTFEKGRTIGVDVDGEKWHIVLNHDKDAKNNGYLIKRGFPTEPGVYFKTTEDALRKVHQGKMNALTGAAKAFSSDYAPFDLDVMEGFQPGADFIADILPFMFHFWTKGTPEVIEFGTGHTRHTHGAEATVFYYQPGFRSAFVILYPGQHANENPNSRVNPFPTLLIVTKGTATAKINGKDSTLSEHQAILIPAGVSHEFINNSENPVECILLMFGDGA